MERGEWKGAIPIEMIVGKGDARDEIVDYVETSKVSVCVSQ